MTIKLNLMQKLNKISVLDSRISDIPADLKSLTKKANSFHSYNRSVNQSNVEVNENTMALMKFVANRDMGATNSYKTKEWQLLMKYSIPNLHEKLEEMLLAYHRDTSYSETFPISLVESVNDNILKNDLVHILPHELDENSLDSNTFMINLWEMFNGTGEKMSSKTLETFGHQLEQFEDTFKKLLSNESNISQQTVQYSELLDFAMFLTRQVEASVLSKLTVKYNMKDILVSSDDNNSVQKMNTELVNNLKMLLNSNDMKTSTEETEPMMLVDILEYMKATKLTTNEVEDIANAGKGVSFLRDLIEFGRTGFISPIHNLTGYVKYDKPLSEVVLPPHIKKYIDYLNNELKINLNTSLRNKVNTIFEMFSDKKKFFENVLLKLDKVHSIVFIEMFDEKSQNVDTVFKYIQHSVNMNTLTEKALIDLMKIKKKDLFKKQIAFEITAEEYILLCEKSTFPHLEVIHNEMRDWKIAERINALQILPTIGEDLEGILFDFVDGEEFINAVLNLLSQPQAKHYRSQCNKNLSKGSAFVVSLFADKHPILRESTTDWELWLLFNTLKQGIAIKTVTEAKQWFMSKSTDVKTMKKWLDLSDAFTQDNTEGVLQFLQKGLDTITRQHHTNTANAKKDNIKLLAKAEIAGKLKEIKLTKEGVEAELQERISQDVYENWFEDKSATITTEVEVKGTKNTPRKTTKFTFDVEETTDYATLLKMGRIPTHSCMDWEDGQFRGCLLSIFDSNKKLVVAKVNGKVVARAVLRFTKIADKDVKVSFDSKNLRFEDVDTTENASAKTNNNSLPQTTLFLERLYTTYTGGQLTAIRTAMLELIAKKAMEMDVEFTTSSGYNSTDNIQLEPKHKYMLISHSKNGEQYLDSLGGNANSSAGGTYKVADIRVMKK